MKGSAILAAGASTRFGAADKLQAHLGGTPILEHVISSVKNVEADCIFLIESEITEARDKITSIFNPRAKDGQASSLACAARIAIEAGVTELLIVLGDMPFVKPEYLNSLKTAKGDVVFSRYNNRLMPPAIFRGEAIHHLVHLKGDAGARSVNWDDLGFNVGEHNIPALQARDIDTIDDLIQAQSS